MTASGLLLFAGIYGVAVASPGPGIALLISRALGRGLVGLPWFIAGFVVGDIVLMSVALSGLAFIAQTFELAFQAVRIAGALYLVWLAWKIWRAPTIATELSADTVGEPPLNAFLSSLLLTLGNPKAITFFVSIMPLAVDVRAVDAGVYAALVAVVVVVMTPVLTLWAVLADRARRVFRSARALKRLNRGTAVVMAGTAVAIAAQR